MKFNPLLLFLILAAVIISTAILVQSYYAEKINKLNAEKKLYENRLLQNIRLPQVDLGDIFLFAQKNKTVGQSNQGKMYFSAEANKTSADEWLVEIKLEGNSNSLTDGADLQLELNNHLSVVSITAGNAFPIYPRKIISNQSILITGLASINKNSINFGKPRNLFATIKIRPNLNNQSDKGDRVILLNQKETKIYFYGENILDENKNFSQIELN